MKILRKEYKDFLKKKTPGDYAGGSYRDQLIDCHTTLNLQHRSFDGLIKS